VFHDAFADGKREVQSTKCGVMLFKGGYDAEGVQIVIESEPVRLHGGIQGLLPGVSEGRVTDVVNQRQGFCETCIQAEIRGQGAGNLGE